MNKVRLGLIGIGKGGRTVALSQKGLPEIELVAVASTKSAAAREAAERYGARKYYSDYRELLNDREINAVFIATPNHLHCEMAVAAAKAKKHILCDKPMSLTLAEADMMITTARENRVKLMVGFVERFNVSFAVAKQILTSGRIGKPAMIFAKRAHKPRPDRWVLDPKQSGGVLVLAGVHNIDLILWLLDSRPERIYAEMGSYVHDSGFIDNVALVMKLKNGAIANMIESYCMPDKMPHGVDRRIEIIGTTGTIDVDMMKQPLVTCTNNDFRVEDTLTWPVICDEMTGALREELKEFARCILQDREPEANGEAGRMSLEVALAAHAAFEGKRIVEFPFHG